MIVIALLILIFFAILFPGFFRLLFAVIVLAALWGYAFDRDKAGDQTTTIENPQTGPTKPARRVY